ncbi:SPOR domain-containing protein [Clostridium sp. D2Q-11]|uniref:SPOR domain-containing protein n=1 Tax=Anaeromonas frigoriresistens TaxID=2683708 RepID=A0A942UQ23_9FIRM|nr:SPOR domain-containing protein [Anaeromonas frigoriresistens]MBS4537194.1 SPOR domain-containing protein [Anaeromonas frigoriresistens]
MGRYKRKYRKRQTSKDKLVFIVLFGIISPIVSIILGFFLVKYMIYPKFISDNNNSVTNNSVLEQEGTEDTNSSNNQVNINNLNIFSVQTGSFSDLDNAKSLVKSLNNKNIPGYIVKLDNYKVLSGTFLNQIDAEEYKQFLNQNIEEIFINENIIEGKSLINEEVEKEAVKKISELIDAYSKSYINETTLWKEALISKDQSKVKEMISKNNKLLADIHKEIESKNELISNLNIILDSRMKIQEELNKENLIAYYSDYNKTLIEYINIIRKDEGD